MLAVMSAGFQHSDSPSSNTFSRNGAHILQFESLPDQTQPTQADDPHNACPLPRFDSLTLDELSEELDRRTKETQRLQDELENATKLTLERFGCIYSTGSHGSSGSPGQSCNIHHLSVSDDSSPDCAIHLTPPQTMTWAHVSNLDGLMQGVFHDARSTKEEVFENVKDDCLLPQSGLQCNKAPNQSGEETFSLDTAIIKLQTELLKVQTEKDVFSDSRFTASTGHVCQVEKMLRISQELHHIKRARDQKLNSQKKEAVALDRRVEMLEQNVKRFFFSLLPQDKQHEDNAVINPNVVSGSKKLSPVAALAEELKDMTDGPPERPFFVAEHLRTEDCCGGMKQNQRMKEIITSLGQEMALLTDKLSSSKNNSVSLSHKVELLTKLAERQTSLHQLHVSELVSTLSTCKDKVCCLEQKLIQAQTQLVDAKREKEQFLQQAEELQSRLDQAEALQQMRCSNQQCELQEEVRVLKGKLVATRKQLCEDREEKMSLQTLLKQMEQERRKSQERLENNEVHRVQQKNQQHLARLEEVQKQRHALHADREALRLRLVDREKQIDILRSQMESSTEMTEQHRHTIDNLHRENNLLNNQLNQQKLEIQQLMTDLKQYKSDVAACEQERQRLQVSVSEHSQHLQEEREKKQQLTAQLELQQTQLLTLKIEHRQLQRLHSTVKQEHQGVVLKLQGQLRNACDELEQVRGSLKTLQGADGHGLQAALDMQEKITARREQIDTLQTKIKHLEETVEKLHQEKSHLSLEHQQQLQELTLAKEEKRQLRDELEALRSKDKQLRDRIGQLEAILHKMSESFADCQDFLELQDQEFYRLKLQHALDLKELQGQNVRAALTVSPPYLAPPSALAAPPTSQCASNSANTPKRQQDHTARELRSLVRELRAVISENRRPHTDNNAAGSGFRRRRSAPEREHRTTFRTGETDGVKAAPRLRRKTWGSEPQSLKTAELSGKPIDNKPLSENLPVARPVTAAKFTSSPHPPSPGRKSPVYALLTSVPNS